MSQTLFVLGGTGFIGSRLVSEAVAQGHSVVGLARSAQSAAKLEAAGARAVIGSLEAPQEWAEELRGAASVIDLIQPPLPTRLSERAVRKVVAARSATTLALLEALASIPDASRPLLFSISGADDLERDDESMISHHSGVSPAPTGYGRIGVPIHALVAKSGVDVTFVHFGVMVYGPGKAYAEHYVDGLKKHRTRIIGDGGNRLPLVHVADAARALVHLAGLEREQLAGRTYLAIDGSQMTQREFVALTAAGLGIRPPGRVPTFLARLLAGPANAEALTFDAQVDNSALAATGFRFLYPSPREGIPPTLADLRA